MFALRVLMPIHLMGGLEGFQCDEVGHGGFPMKGHASSDHTQTSGLLFPKRGLDLMPTTPANQQSRPITVATVAIRFVNSCW